MSTTIVPTNTDINVAQEAVADTLSLAINPTDAIIVVEIDVEVTANSAVMSIFPTVADVSNNAEVNATFNTLTIVGTNTTINIQREVVAETASIVFSTQEVSIWTTDPQVGDRNIINIGPLNRTIEQYVTNRTIEQYATNRTLKVG